MRYVYLLCPWRTYTFSSTCSFIIFLSLYKKMSMGRIIVIISPEVSSEFRRGKKPSSRTSHAQIQTTARAVAHPFVLPGRKEKKSSLPSGNASPLYFLGSSLKRSHEGERTQDTKKRERDRERREEESLVSFLLPATSRRWIFRNSQTRAASIFSPSAFALLISLNPPLRLFPALLRARASRLFLVSVYLARTLTHTYTHAHNPRSSGLYIFSLLLSLLLSLAELLSLDLSPVLSVCSLGVPSVYVCSHACLVLIFSVSLFLPFLHIFDYLVCLLPFFSFSALTARKNTSTVLNSCLDNVHSRYIIQYSVESASHSIDRTVTRLNLKKARNTNCFQGIPLVPIVDYSCRTMSRSCC